MECKNLVVESGDIALFGNSCKIGAGAMRGARCEALYEDEGGQQILAILGSS
jgi:hypothetical protein